MGFHLTDTHLECLEKEDRQVVGGWIKVIARTRKQSKKHGFGALIQWRNMDGVLLQDIVFNRVLHGDQSRQVRDALIDSGYWLEPYPQSWPRLQRYLLQEIVKAPAGICVDTTGWHDRVFVTQDWSVGMNSEPYYYAGQLNDSMLKSAGTSAQWQSQVGAQGRRMIIFRSTCSSIDQSSGKLIRFDCVLRCKRVHSGDLDQPLFCYGPETLA